MDCEDSNDGGDVSGVEAIDAEARSVECESGAEADEARALQREVSGEEEPAAPTFVALLARSEAMQATIGYMLAEAAVEDELEFLEELRVAMDAVADSLRARLEGPREDDDAAPAVPPEPVPARRGRRGGRK